RRSSLPPQPGSTSLASLRTCPWPTRAYVAAEAGFSYSGPAGITLHDAVRLAVVGEELEERVGKKRLGAEDARPLPGAGCEQLERDDRVERGLEHYSLMSVLAHRLLVVGHVVEVDGAVAPVLALPGDERAGTGLAAHPVA